MGQLLVRSLNEELIRALKQRAARSGRSVEAEHRVILEQALRTDVEDFATAAARMRASTPKQSSDSADIVRRDRDRNHADTQQ